MLAQHLTFIGGGNMARSLIGGLIANGFAANQIRVVDPNKHSANSWLTWALRFMKRQPLSY